MRASLVTRGGRPWFSCLRASACRLAGSRRCPRLTLCPGLLPRSPPGALLETAIQGVRRRWFTSSVDGVSRAAQGLYAQPLGRRCRRRPPTRRNPRAAPHAKPSTVGRRGLAAAAGGPHGCLPLELGVMLSETRAAAARPAGGRIPGAVVKRGPRPRGRVEDGGARSFRASPSRPWKFRDSGDARCLPRSPQGLPRGSESLR